MDQKKRDLASRDWEKMMELKEADFARQDDQDDRIFYEIERPGPHLDSLALKTVENIMADLIVDEEPMILDLMAGMDSHLPRSIKAKAVVGLGLSEGELKKNSRLTDYLVQDLNRDRRLPFESGTFDVVLNTVSVDYLVNPIEIFEEVSRVLKPGGLFLVIFSNRYFPEKAVKIWKEANDEERILLVEEYFRRSRNMEKPSIFASRGQPRPERDKYAHLGIPSDPVYAVYGERKGEAQKTLKRPDLTDPVSKAPRDADFQTRKRSVGKTLCCPHCEQKLSKWEVPDHPFSEWDNDYMYICFNDLCSYYTGGWSTLARQGNHGVSYRYLFNPRNGGSTPIPVPSPNALKSGIVDG